MITCDHHTLVVLELLGEEARHNQLWVHEEKNLFLHEAGAENTSTQPAVGKIHLNAFRKQKQTPLRTLPAGGPWVHGSVLTCSMPVPSVSMVPCDETYSLFIVSLQLTSNETSQPVNSIHYTRFVLVKSTDLQPGGFKKMWSLPFPDLDVGISEEPPLKCHQSIQLDFYRVADIWLHHSTKSSVAFGGFGTNSLSSVTT